VATNPRVYINGKFLCQQATGVQKFALGLSQALQAKHPEIVVIVPKGKHPHQGLMVKEYGYGQGFFWEQIWLPLFLWFHPHSILLSFCNTAPLLIKKQIVTIHDLAFRKNKDWFSASFRLWYNFLIPHLCKRSLQILSVSEFSKQEICKAYGVSSNKIHVVPNSVPLMDFDAQRPYPFPYLLLTGIFNPRKNAAFIFSLLPEIKEKGFHIMGVGMEADIFGKTTFPKDENVHILNNIDDRQYYTLMKHADALVFPSEYEGFGIPVLEALVLATPAIVPDVAVYRESFGDIPLYYAAGDAKMLLRTLDNINIHKPATNSVDYLKNKFNFDAAENIVTEIIYKLIQHP